VREVGLAIIDDDIQWWCTYEDEESGSRGTPPWHPQTAVAILAHELVALHQFDSTNAHLIAEDLYYRLDTGTGAGRR
jgi:hypothetical protein